MSCFSGTTDMQVGNESAVFVSIIHVLVPYIGSVGLLYEAGDHEILHVIHTLFATYPHIQRKSSTI